MDELQPWHGQRPGKPVGEVTGVGEELAGQPWAPVGHGRAAIAIAECQLETDEFASRVDKGVQREALNQPWTSGAGLDDVRAQMMRAVALPFKTFKPDREGGRAKGRRTQHS